MSVNRHFFAAVVALAIAGFGVAQAVAAEPAAGLSPQSSSAAGVTIRIVPKNLSAGAPVWEFEMVLDTHSQDLSDDLLKSTLLLDGAGGRHAPIAWEGAKPGGHHRSGVLRFKPLAPLPRVIELQIARPGESAPRSFRWPLK